LLINGIGKLISKCSRIYHVHFVKGHPIVILVCFLLFILIVILYGCCIAAVKGHHCRPAKCYHVSMMRIFVSMHVYCVVVGLCLSRRLFSVSDFGFAVLRKVVGLGGRALSSVYCQSYISTYEC